MDDLTLFLQAWGIHERYIPPILASRARVLNTPERAAQSAYRERHIRLYRRAIRESGLAVELNNG